SDKVRRLNERRINELQNRTSSIYTSIFSKDRVAGPPSRAGRSDLVVESIGVQTRNRFTYASRPKFCNASLRSRLEGTACRVTSKIEQTSSVCTSLSGCEITFHTAF